jgi:hypothetical protein
MMRPPFYLFSLQEIVSMLKSCISVGTASFLVLIHRRFMTSSGHARTCFTLHSPLRHVLLAKKMFFVSKLWKSCEGSVFNFSVRGVYAMRQHNGNAFILQSVISRLFFGNLSCDQCCGKAFIQLIDVFSKVEVVFSICEGSKISNEHRNLLF